MRRIECEFVLGDEVKSVSTYDPDNAVDMIWYANQRRMVEEASNPHVSLRVTEYEITVKDGWTINPTNPMSVEDFQ